ncbi:hypothetical protein LSAT2_006244 [Lamellibrachia satsuma]|nr:hypothetical protein LSAT2_006244 [Lamellibrachia satsuma]
MDAATMCGFAYGARECTQETIVGCFMMMGNLTDGATILTKSNEEQMRALCRNYGKFETCIASLKPTCSKMQMNEIGAFDRAFSFLCEKKNLDDYLKHADCFSKMNMDKTTATCTRTLQSETNAAKGSKTRLCQIIGDYVNCVVKPVSSKCGDAAARYMRRMFVYFMKPSLHSIDCEISGGTSRVINSVMVTVLAVMVLPVLTLLGV